jgi:subtilisin family serine protease
MKPDLCSYTHFRGSGVYPADGGTSAATPVVAGAVAAFRSRFHVNTNDPASSPAAIRHLITKTAENRGAIGFDFDYGWASLTETGSPKYKR